MSNNAFSNQSKEKTMTIQPTHFEDLPKYYDDPLWSYCCSTQCEHSNFHLRRKDAELEVDEYLTEEAKKLLGVDRDEYITEVPYSCYILENDDGIFIEEDLEDLPTGSDDQVIYKVDGEFYEIDMGSLYEIQKMMEKRRVRQGNEIVAESNFADSTGVSL